MPSVIIDGAAIDFQPGESIIEVAERSGVEIPYYCWHPRLSVAANCRMCLVEVEGAPKLAPACQTGCRDAMVVNTTNERVQGAQRAVHEFLLINHPIDCPICDQAGECKLQDYYMKWDLTGSRMVSTKQHKPRLEQLGPYVVLNAERCIVCTRCVRFMEEVAKDRQLGVFQRGDHAYIGVAPGESLDSPYSLNTVDVCPVGALTSRAFRFKQRVWNLRRGDSLCGGCARGCNTHVDARSGQVYRMLPRDNEAVNQAWMCDEGRLTYSRANDDRLTTPLAREPGSAAPAQPVGVDVALRYATELLAPHADGGGRLGVALSLHATSEDAYVLGRLCKEIFGVGRVGIFGYANGEGDDILRVPDKNPNRAGITAVLADLDLEVVEASALSGHEALLCMGHEGDGIDALMIPRPAAVVHLASATSAGSAAADVTLPSAAWVQVDGTWVNVDRRAQRLTPTVPLEGDARANHAWLLELGSRLGLAFALPSAQTIRAEMERRLESFKGSGLTDLGPGGRPLV